MSSQIVTYRVDDSTTVKFEIEPTEGFHPASPDQVLTIFNSGGYRVRSSGAWWAMPEA